jgi:hypothetical protein
MIRRLLIAGCAATVGVITVPVTSGAHPAPSLVSPTTTTTTPRRVAVASSPTTTPQLATPTTPTTTTLPPVIANPTTTTSTTTTSTTTTLAPSVIGDPPAPPPVIVTPTVPPDGDPADTPIGSVDTSGGIPDGLDLSAIPGVPAAPTADGSDGPTFSAGQTCFNQCIKSGVAYPRGFGALLVVETYVPAQVWLGVSADTDGDGGYDFNDHASSNGMVTEFSWALDHLEPGQTYYVIVAATDENDDTAHAYGSFTTLSQRTITMSIGSPTISGGPSNIVDNYVFLKVADLDFRWLAPPENLVYYSLPRRLDLALQLFRGWETSQYTICEGFFPSLDHAPSGHSDSLCGTWNTAMLANLDIDAVPAGRSSWTEVSIMRTMQTAAGDGALPPGHGDPRYFDFNATVTLTVEYG